MGVMKQTCRIGGVHGFSRVVAIQGAVVAEERRGEGRVEGNLGVCYAMGKFGVNALAECRSSYLACWLDRYAETVPVLVIERMSGYVDISFGAIDLYWLELNLLLVLHHRLPQRPSEPGGYGWARDAFHRKRAISGRTKPLEAPAIGSALRDRLGFAFELYH